MLSPSPLVRPSDVSPIAGRRAGGSGGLSNEGTNEGSAVPYFQFSAARIGVGQAASERAGL